MDDPIWKPEQGEIEQANLTRFRTQLASDYDIALADYPALYDWSLKNPREFWIAAWNDGEIIAETRGTRLLDNPELMPGARWFPESRLNFAENLLRNPDERDAIVFRGEDRVERRLSRRELYDHVSRLAQAMEAMGIQASDRVAGYMPNMPEAGIAMLATTSLGAIWSSCSPDFGVNGVVDRFGQIEPKLLFAAEGYYYNGKTFDRLENTAKIEQAIPGLEKVVVIPYTREHPPIDNIPKAVMLDEFLGESKPTEIDFRQLPFDHPLYIMFSAPPVYPSASSTVPAGPCCSISRNCVCTAT